MNDESRAVGLRLLIHHSSLIIHHLLFMPEAISEYVPQLTQDEESARRARRARGAWGLVLACAAGLVGLIVGAPLLKAAGAGAAADAVYRGFGLVCHQMGER